MSLRLMVLDSIKHYPDKHNQDRHGWRYGKVANKLPDDKGEKAEYLKRLADVKGVKLDDKAKETKPKKQNQKPIERPKQPETVAPTPTPVAPKAEEPKPVTPKPEQPKVEEPKATEYKKIQPSDLSDFHDKQYADFSELHKDALWKYTAESTPINKLLRNDGFDDSKADRKVVQETINQLDSAFKKSGGMPEDATLLRGIQSDLVSNMIKDGTLKVGSIMTDSGFVSTSLNSPFSGNIRMNINVPKGSPAININGTSKYPSEAEVLLPRNLPMRVVSIKTSGLYGSYHEIELEVINDKK